MIIKHHLCGLAIAYEPRTIRTGEKTPGQFPSRPQGSRYSQQKRKVADAVEWMRIYGDHKPLIFVATSPGYTALADENKLISKLTANLRNGYGVENYVWVREYTQKGFPHFHFVADAEYIDAVKLSSYWSGLFGYEGKGFNGSIRLGTKPIPGRKRCYHVHSQSMAWYLSKYLGKGMNDRENKNPSNTKPGNDEGIPGLTCRVRSPRMFHVSKKLAERSAPLKFGEYIAEMNWGAPRTREFVLCNEQAEQFYENDAVPPSLNPHKFYWSWTGHGMTYIGRPKDWKQKKPSGVGSTGEK